MKFTLNALPETLINLLQSLVPSAESRRRVAVAYLGTAEVSAVLPLEQQAQTIVFQSCMVTCPLDRAAASFPPGALPLVCGNLGSCKTLLLLALLGEADLLTGQMLCPRPPPNALAAFTDVHVSKEWVVQGIRAFVPQAAWSPVRPK
ncbi:hypothetical protein B0H17DRAFT_1215473 [Mycena rosella]|uniref:Uncharacterized protein n=1 Tax=Mycena rosella TaxID=1033263 RepID=A0AAD7CHR6_MYCRO|nr:hypothetical protein B0H17DRAFT_1215473 [Mycena rosella]